MNTTLNVRIRYFSGPPSTQRLTDMTITLLGSFFIPLGGVKLTKSVRLGSEFVVKSEEQGDDIET